MAEASGVLCVVLYVGHSIGSCNPGCACGLAVADLSAKTCFPHIVLSPCLRIGLFCSCSF